MEKLFGTIITESRDLLSDHSPVDIPSDYANAAKGPIQFNAHFYRETLGEMRAVYIEGPKIEIVNLFYFPDTEKARPIYAMEFVQMGKRAVVGVIDVAADAQQKTASEEARSMIAPVRERYPDLEQGNDPPQWFQECRSGNDFFVRPEGAAQLTRLCEAHFDVFKNYYKKLRTSSANTAGADSEGRPSYWQSAYKTHHAENSPGLPFLNRTFGEDWANIFLHKYLFA